MNSELVEKIDQLLESLDNSDLIKELEETKRLIYEDKDLQIELDKLKELQDNIYSEQYKEQNIKLFQNENYKKFISLSADVNFLILNINNNLKTLIDKKGC